MPDYVPRPDAELETWTKNISDLLLRMPGDFGLTPQEAEAYAQLQADFNLAFQQTLDASERSPAVVRRKNEARESLVARTRSVVRRIRAVDDLPASTFIALGLRPAGDAPAIAPTQAAPRVVVLGVEGRAVRIRVSDPTSASQKRKPHGITGVMIQGAVGTFAEQSALQWRTMGYSTRTTCEAVFEDSLPPGTQVWVAAAWMNRRLQPGPTSPVATAFLGAGGIRLASELRAA